MEFALLATSGSQTTQNSVNAMPTWPVHVSTIWAETAHPSEMLMRWYHHEGAKQPRQKLNS